MMSSIERFLACRRIAIVGVSRDPRDFSRTMYRAWCERGYDVVPVHPVADEIEGRACARRVQEIDPPAEAALVMTPAAESERIVIDCAAAGIRLVWLHRGAGRGAVSDSALRAGQAAGLDVVPGACPMMYLPGTSWFHRLHRGWARVFGRAA